MVDRGFPEAVLVGVDFSACSLRALETALRWRPASTEVTVLHVVDSELARRADAAGVTSYADAVAKMRTAAESELERLVSDKNTDGLETMLVEGLPFVEIVKISNDLDCDLIVLGSRGDSSSLRELLFGNTAEQVLRTALKPVLCVP